jgi:hypothetical protein
VAAGWVIDVIGDGTVTGVEWTSRCVSVDGVRGLADAAGPATRPWRIRGRR